MFIVISLDLKTTNSSACTGFKKVMLVELKYLCFHHKNLPIFLLAALTVLLIPKGTLFYKITHSFHFLNVFMCAKPCSYNFQMQLCFINDKHFLKLYYDTFYLFYCLNCLLYNNNDNNFLAIWSRYFLKKIHFSLTCNVCKLR